ncbi:MAG: LytTR family DNA-binding domain-containing protein [Gemmatimonadales bacterium]
MPPAASIADRVRLHVTPARRVVVEPDDVYLLQADRNDTIVRKRGRRTIRDVRQLGQVTAVFSRHGFYRIHDRWCVNLRRVREIRRQHDGRDWEVVMQPPVNRVLSVSRARLPGLLRHFGERA